jgi:hypothetical protein
MLSTPSSPPPSPLRSPVEWGDLYAQRLSPPGPSLRLTHTMPLGLRAKLSPPQEITIGGLHALLYAPVGVSQGDVALSELQPLVWAHGGPMTVAP